MTAYWTCVALGAASMVVGVPLYIREVWRIHGPAIKKWVAS